MPRGNGTGPMGMGPMTSRGMGCCAGFSVPDAAGCFGNGRGNRRMFHMTGLPGYMRFGSKTYSPAYEEAGNERAALKSRKEYLEEQLHHVKKRLSDLREDDE